MPKVSVVIPTIGKDRMIIDLLQQIAEQNDDIVRQIIVLDNGMDEATRNDCMMFPDVVKLHAPKMNIYQMWNHGVKLSLGRNPHDYIAILNDDLILSTDAFFTKLVEPLDIYQNIWATCGNYDNRESDQLCVDAQGTFKDGGFAGFCFAVRGEAYIKGLPLFEERYNWWYGDDDLMHNIHKRGYRTTMTIDARMIHIDNGSKSVIQYTEDFNRKVASDQEVYMRKWHNHG